MIIPKISLIIYVDADKDICLSRIKSRRFPLRIKNRSDREILTFIENSKEACKIAVGKFKKVFNDSKVITIINNFDLDTSISKLKKEIQIHFEERGSV